MLRIIISDVAKSRGLNQSQLQLRAGVSPQLLNRYWNNRTRSVALDQLEKIAKALDVRPGDLIAREEDTRPRMKAIDAEAAQPTDQRVHPGRVSPRQSPGLLMDIIRTILTGNQQLSTL